MAIRQMNRGEIQEIIAKTGFDYDLMVKDYHIINILYLIKDIKGIYFKGGTALQLTLLGYTRLSEDIDFTVNRSLFEVRKEIESAVDGSGLFGEITEGKNVDGFVRLIIPYESILGKDVVFIDLNERGRLLLAPEQLDIGHMYPNIPKFNFPCLNAKEMIAEKVAAAIGRNKPRDHYDIYQIIKHGHKIDMDIVKMKCENSGDDPDIGKMFNNAKKLHRRWNEDMLPLIADDVTFQEVMKTLAGYFGLKG